MKKFIYSLFILTATAVIISSCGDKNTINPIPDPTPGNHEILWSYDMGVGGSLEDIFPAIDNNNNSYYSVYSMDLGKLVVFGLDKDGNEIWKKEVTGGESGRTIYADGKVYVATNSPTAIYCFNASNGVIDWEKDLSAEYDFGWSPAIAFANNKLYVSSGQIFEGYLIAYDPSGNEVWVKQTNIMGGSLNLSVIGNSLYFYADESLFRFDDNGAQCDSVWEYKLQNKSSKSLIALYDLPIGADGNIYIRSTDINIISPVGQLVRTITLDASFNEGYASNILLTSDNDILIGKGNLVKLSNSGAQIWETDINDGLIINPSFTTAPTISSNGDFYDAQLFGLYSIKSNGSLNWKVNAENGGGVEYGNLHPPVLTYEGNIISVSIEQKMVRCFKGDGEGLAGSGWPKPYGDYGNTNSK